jgi:hypothetical protein
MPAPASTRPGRDQSPARPALGAASSRFGPPGSATSRFDLPWAWPLPGSTRLGRGQFSVRSARVRDFPVRLAVGVATSRLDSPWARPVLGSVRPDPRLPGSTCRGRGHFPARPALGSTTSRLDPPGSAHYPDGPAEFPRSVRRVGPVGGDLEACRAGKWKPVWPVEPGTGVRLLICPAGINPAVRSLSWASALGAGPRTSTPDLARSTLDAGPRPLTPDLALAPHPSDLSRQPSPAPRRRGFGSRS